MTVLEEALLIVGIPFLVLFALMCRSDRRWHREHDDED